MADSFIQIDADGVGKKIDSRTDSVGDHRQVVVIGDDGTTDGVARADATNGLDVDVTRVSGNVTIVDGSGSITVDAPVGTPLRVDPTGTTTQPVSGTITANLSATDNAVLDNIDADTSAIQTAVELVDDTVYVDDADWTDSTSKHLLVGGLYQSVPQTITDGDVGPFQVDENGRMLVSDQGALSEYTEDIATPADPNGLSIMGRRRDTLSSEVTAAGDWVALNASAFGELYVAGGQLSIFRSIDLDEGALEVVKASAGTVYGMWVTNTATATRWIKFYNATSGTIGTGTPVITIGIPGNATDDIAGNFGPGGMGIFFSTGISVGASTGVADADVGAPGANDVIVNVFYR